MHSPTQLLVNQSFSFNDIDIEIDHREMPLTIEQMRIIDESWDTALREAHNAGRKLWDSMTYRLGGFSISDGRLRLRLSEVPYRVRYVIARGLQKEKLRGCVTDGLSTGALTETSDGAFLFGTLSGTTTSKSRYSAFGGTACKNECIIRSATDLWHSLLLELHEEGGITEEHIAEKSVEAIVRSDNDVVLLLAHVRLHCTSDEAQKLFAKRLDDEMSELHIVKKEDLPHVLAFTHFGDTLEPVFTKLLKRER